MADYIDRQALGIGKADRNAFNVPEYADGWNSAIEIIENAPTADVVPKSEVEQIFEEIERFLYLQFRFCKEELGNGDTKYMEGRLELNTQIQNFIAELKKKYI